MGHTSELSNKASTWEEPVLTGFLVGKEGSI